MFFREVSIIREKWFFLYIEENSFNYIRIYLRWFSEYKFIGGREEAICNFLVFEFLRGGRCNREELLFWDWYYYLLLLGYFVYIYINFF